MRPGEQSVTTSGHPMTEMSFAMNLDSPDLVGDLFLFPCSVYDSAFFLFKSISSFDT